MNILGKRIIIRALEENDNAILNELINDPDIEASCGGWSFPVSMFKQDEWFRKIEHKSSELRCMIEDIGTSEVVGTVIMSDIDYKNGTAEIHVKILKKYFGKGYGTEAVGYICKYGFYELRLNCLYAIILESNKASVCTFEKVGFKSEGVMRKRLYKNGEYQNIVSMSLLKEELVFYEGNRK